MESEKGEERIKMYFTTLVHILFLPLEHCGSVHKQSRA